MYFKNFALKEIFYSQSGDFDIQQAHINNNGIAVCSSGEKNQGIIGLTDIPAKIINKNSLTVDMFGNVFYRDFDYKIVTHGRIFTLEGNYTQNVFLYFVACLQYLKKIFSFDEPCSWNKIQDFEILLPTNDGINPYYEYMESYIQNFKHDYINELKQEKTRELNNYYKVTGLSDYKLSEYDKNILNKNVLFKNFKIEELFNIKTGRDVIINTLENGDIPLISHQCDNNGITKYIKKLTNRVLFDYRSTIPLADRGLFHASCQNKDFHIGTRVKALTFKDGEKTEKQRLYVVSSINKLQFHFSDYLTNATDKLPNLEIYLPVGSDGKPDYGYMEKYITAIEKLTIKNLVEYKDKIIEKTKQVCSE